MTQVTSIISNFNLKRNKILDKLGFIKEILIKQDLDLAALENIKERLIDNNFSIIVVGEFNGGKSTFINALLRKKLLPAKGLPTTAIITIIEDGQPEAIVYYKNKKVKNITIDEIQGFATALTDEGEEEASKIEHMLIKYPCEYTKEGVKIIDTPGVEDLDKAREEITYEMIPKADAAILILDARRALKNSERIFLKEKILGNNINKLFFILNFADAICDTNMQQSNEKLQVIVDKVTQDLRLIIGKDDIKVHAISAKKVLQENKTETEGEFTKKFNSFEKELQEFLVAEKGEVLLGNAVLRADSIIDDTQKIISFKINSLNKPLEELKLKENELNKIIERIRQEKRLIKQDVNKAFNDLPIVLTPEIEAIVEKVITNVEGTEVPENCEDIQEFYKTILKNLLAKDMDSLIDEKFQANIKTIIIKTEKRLLSILSELDNFINIDASNNSFLFDEININSEIDEKDILLKQLAMGAGAFFAVPLILSLIGTVVIIPVIIGYVFSGIAIFKWKDAYKRSAIIKEIKNSKTDIIKSINKQIKDKVMQTSSEYCKAIDNLIEGKIKDTALALEQVIKEKEKLSTEEENILNSLGGLDLKLNNLSIELKIIVKDDDLL